MDRKNIALYSLLAAFLMTPSIGFAKAPLVKIGVAYSDQKTEFRPSTGNQTDTDSHTTSMSASYRFNKSTTASGNMSFTSTDSKGVNNNSVSSSSITRILGATVSHKLNKNLSVFGGYNRGYVSSDTVVSPGSVFFNNNINLDVYVAGASYVDRLTQHIFYGVTGVIAYASVDVDQYLLEAGFGTRPGSNASTTSWTLSPFIVYQLGRTTFTSNYSQKRKNQAGGAAPDRSTGKAKLGVKHSFTRAISLGMDMSIVTGKKATDSNAIAVKFGYKF